jgi:phosphoglycerate dehydrogenase-like enzyme
MRIFASENAARRVAQALAAHELIIMDANGVARSGGKEVALDLAQPEIVWLTFDSLMSGQLDTFFNVALSGSTKWMHTQQTGLDSPRYSHVVARGIKLTNSHAQAPAIAEYVMTNVLAVNWPIGPSRTAQIAREWKRMPFRELMGTHWLIIGMGAIGREIAVRAKAFGVKITGLNRDGRPDPAADATGTLADLPRLLPTADIVVLATAQTKATTDLVDAKFIAAMKKSSLLVNIARGGLIVDEALLAGLDNGTPSVAILDTFREEPLPPEHPYWKHPRAIVTAHTSSGSTGTLPRADNFFLENLRRYQGGEPLLSQVGADAF